MNQGTFANIEQTRQKLRFENSHDDAVLFLHRQPRLSIDLIVTDPAYASLEKHRKVGSTTRLKSWFPIFPDSRYQAFFNACYMALKQNAHCYIMCDETTLFIIKPIAEQCGFKFWKSIIWDKQKLGMGYHWRNKTERVAFFEKGQRRLNNLALPDLLSYPRIEGGYPTEKPKELYRDIIENSTQPGEIVADPFFGSGNGLLAANELGRHAVGTDISDAAHEHLNQRRNNGGDHD